MRIALPRLIAAAILAVSVSAPPVFAAPPTLEQQVEAFRARADKSAAKKQWSVAIKYISEARKKVRTARRAAMTPSVKTPTTAAYKRDMVELRNWIVSQEKLARAGTKTRKQIGHELRARRTAINRKHGIPNPGGGPSAATARYDLLAASLEDTVAGYYAKKGDTREATAHRRAALVTRLQVYRDQGKAQAASQVAEKLLVIAPGEPESYSVAASYFQETGQCKRAVQIWDKGIQALESGTALARPAGASQDRTRARNQHLGYFYRQQSYCLYKLGRITESKAAMQKATQLEPKRRS